MKRFLIFASAAALLSASGWTSEAVAGFGSLKGRATPSQSQTYPWHGGYYDAAWGMPVALVVPPTAENQVHYNWGVGGMRVTPIQHQFERGYPGPGAYNRSWFRPTPPWPSSTDQFGDYYIRGPW
jgi:hypothetical protein